MNTQVVKFVTIGLRNGSNIRLAAKDIVGQNRWGENILASPDGTQDSKRRRETVHEVCVRIQRECAEWVNDKLVGHLDYKIISVENEGPNMEGVE